jgi:hypothetical protein
MERGVKTVDAPKTAPVRWMGIDEAAHILGVPVVSLRRTIERNARKHPNGSVDARVDGIVARKLGRLWRVVLDPAWMRPTGRVTLSSCTAAGNVIDACLWKHASWRGEKAMAVRIEERRGKRRLIIDIWYRKQDGTLGRYRKDAEVQTLAAARAEERRRVAALAASGSPEERKGEPPATEPQSAPPESERCTTTASGPLFKDVGEAYLRVFAPSHMKPSTAHGYAAVIRHILVPKIGMLPVDAVDATQVREIDADLVRRGVRPATRRNVQAVLRSVLCRYAVEAKILAKAPELPRLPKVGKKVMVALTKGEVERILAAPARRTGWLSCSPPTPGCGPAKCGVCAAGTSTLPVDASSCGRASAAEWRRRRNRATSARCPWCQRSRRRSRRRSGRRATPCCR